MDRIPRTRRMLRLPFRATPRLLAVFAALAAALVAAAAAFGALVAVVTTRPVPLSVPDRRTNLKTAALVLPDPTPVFARQGRLWLHLPVEPMKITVLAFHQAAEGAIEPLPMVSLVPESDPGSLRRLTTRGRSYPGSRTAETSQGVRVFTGPVIRLWRTNRRGRPNTAADVGAEPGTPILAPVNGTVSQVVSYRLYGKWPDHRIHIRPSARPDVEVVLIHLGNPRVKRGDPVIGGVTQVGSVRRLDDKIEGLQLKDYTREGGNHVHVQLNRVFPHSRPTAQQSTPASETRLSR